MEKIPPIELQTGLALLSQAVFVPLLVVHALAAAIWIGGLVTIFIVARIASATLEPARRIAFFRSLGRVFGIVGTGSLLVALASGAILLDDHPWDGLLIATAIVAAALVAALAAGMAQARAMTRLRRRALGIPALDGRVSRGARVATALRVTIAALTLVLVVLGASLVA